MGALGWLSNLGMAGSPFFIAVITPPRVVFQGHSSLAAKASTFGILTWESGAVHASRFTTVRAVVWGGDSAHAAAVTTLDVLSWHGLAEPAALISEAP